jgi:AraC-like DNA-binding protein
MMSIDLPHVPAATRSRVPATGHLTSAALGRLPLMRSGDDGETISPGRQAIAVGLASQSSAIRLRVSGAAAVLSLSMESDVADLVRDPQTMIDLTGSEFDADHLAVIMRWLGERLSAHSDASRKLTSGGLTKWRLKRVLSYIDQHICEPITLATLAEVAGLSRMYFAAQFRAATGCRPHECVLRKRIQRAQQMLLETSEPLVNIALAIGFQSQAHFSTVFKRFAGLSPYQWRVANRDLPRGVQYAHSGAGDHPKNKPLDGARMAARQAAERSLAAA